MNVLVAADIADEAIARLEKHFTVTKAFGLNEKELIERARDADVLVVRSKPMVTRKVIESAKHLKMVARAGVGLDNIDLEACNEHDIQVVNAPSALSESVAELVFAMLLSFERNIVRADNSLKEEKWIKKELKGVELHKKTIGIIGFGRIGSHIATIAKGFGMTPIAYDVHWDQEMADELGVEFRELDALLSESDYVTLHVPLLPQTRGMIAAGELAKMKDSAIIINTSRGGIVDEKALYSALQEGMIRGACLDVFENEPPGDDKLVKHPHVLATPHVGASTEEAQTKAGVIIADKVIEALVP
ncbi:hydroxyacid dehydrogenase [archaeon]|nr:MAG: hydroxyacid dehydrogenase [archaeon]